MEKYVKADEVDELISNIEKRKKLEKELKKLKQCMPKEKNLDFPVDRSERDWYTIKAKQRRLIASASPPA